MPDLERAARAGRGAWGVVRRRSPHPPVRFVLLTSGRAGSTLLMTLLDSVPGVRCDEEVLRTGRGDPTARLARRAARAALGDVLAWGTSVHPEHLMPVLAGDPVDWVAALHDDGYELITLVRANPLAVAVSAVIADARGRWHVRNGEAQPETGSVRLDPLDVLRMAIQTERATEDVARMVAERSHLALVYERDLREADSHQATADRVLRFLGVDAAPVSSPLVRRAVPMLEQIDNLDEVRAVLRPTRFGALLEDIDG